jgi:positive regulator of sigma E activity
VRFDAEIVRGLSHGSKLLDFNIFSLIGDMSVLNIANVVVDKKYLLRKDLIFPIVGRKIDTNDFIVLNDYYETGFVVFDPKDRSVGKSTVQKVIDSVDNWIVMLEPTMIHEIEREEGLILKGSVLSWLRKTFVLILSIFLIYWLFISPIVVSTLMIVSLSGLAVSYLLLLKKYGRSFEAVENFCDAFKQKNGCKKAVDFKFDNLLDDLVSLPDLGVFFFSFSFLVFGVSSYVPLSGHSYWVLIAYVFSLLSSVALFGVQHFKMKAYCPLCLVVISLIIVLNLIILSSWSFNNWHFDLLLFSGLIAMSTAFFLSTKIKLEGRVALSEIALRKDRWDATVFRSLLQSTREFQFNNDNRLMVNFRKGNTVLNIHISDSCDFCIVYLKEMLSLLLLEESYSLAIYLKSDLQAGKTKLQWFENKLEYFFYEYSSFFRFRIGGTEGTLKELIQKHDNGELEAGFLDADDRILRHPSSFLGQKQIPPMYDGKDIKRHLALLKYK